MPLEIRELYIKVTVSDDEQPAETGSDQSSGADNQQETLIRACVEQVLEILRAQKER